MLGGGARRGAGHEEGELELEDGQALGGDGGSPDAGGHELLDPDSLTYIDERLQNVLGHFQKDFEGGVLAENSGSLYGGYGSFLPPNQHSPSVATQSRSPAVPPNRGSASRSPYVPVESAQKSHFVKNGLDSRGKDDYCQRTSNGTNGNPQQRMLNRAVNGPEQKAPKIHIKVNNNRHLARNTAAIYSGLGLDISPSSSMDDSLDGCAGAPEPKNLPDESPHTILQIMTCHPIPGGLLLSPLTENILALRKKSASARKKHEAPAFDDDKTELNRDWCHTTSAAQGDQDDQDSIVPGSIQTEQHSLEASAKLVPDVSNHLNLKETKNVPLKGRIRDKIPLRDIESVHVKAVNLANDGNHPKGKANSEACTARNSFDNLSKDSKTEPTLGQGLVDKVKHDSDGYDHRLSATSSQPNNLPPSGTATSADRDKRKVVHVKDEPSQCKREESGSLVNADSMDIITENVGGNPSGMPKRKMKISSLQTAPSGKKLKVKAHKQLSNGITRKSHGEDKSVKPEKETVSSGETDNGRSDGVNDGDHKISHLNFDRSAPVPSACMTGAMESSVAVPVEPVLINEQWVCCDKCEKWRLLPYWMNPDILPKKWRCNMQSWLHGMNNCKISEDETTKALRAMPPAPENNISVDVCHDIATSGVCAATIPPTIQGDIKSIATSGTLKVDSSANTSNNLKMGEMSKSSKKLEAPTSRNPDDVDCFPKKKGKRKHIGSSDDGETVAVDRLHPESKSSRVGFDHDSLRASKKMNKEPNEPAKHHPSEFEISKSSPSVKGTPKSLHRYSGVSPSTGKYGSSSLVKCNDDKIISNGGIRTSDVGRSDVPELSIKNRKSKQRQLSKRGPDPIVSNALPKHTVEEALSESNHAKENPMPELNFLKAADRKVAHARGPIAGTDSDKECLSEQHQENTHLQQHSLLSQNSMKKNMCYAQASAAATSSSSKVSSSHKSKVDFQETRASPVESVSSSPLRTTDKNLVDQHKRYPSAVAEKVLSQESGKSCLSFSKEKNDFGSGSDHAKAHGSGCLSGDMHHHVLKDGELQKDKQDNECSKNDDSELGTRNGLLNPVKVQKVNSHVLSIRGNGDDKLPPSLQNGKTSPHLNSNQCDHAKLTSGKHPVQVKPDKGDAEQKDIKTNPSTVKGSKQHPALNDSSNGDLSYKAKQLKKAVLENTKQATLSRDALNPVNTSVLLKEARDLKHLSKRLKEKGDDLESANMCFEAGLKFLHVASLLEAPSIDSSKQGDSIQAIRLYSETGNLCGFCAREFERLKKMASAALAYKCVEVAYMKAAFYKHPGAIKDKHALQATSLMVPPAESPSSSASDVDNLNNQSTAAKAISRALYSPKIGGNSIPRNNHHLMGLLAYADDINYAFDGTRKSQSSLAAYVTDMGKGQAEGIALVREVLEFSFHNVKGLLQLIRHSLESINHESVK
ncbi:cysteine-tryptophan domain-containing zinc finger protein 3-like isoform X3 [Triticum dicoccoides]|uniref:cysteine-tryptophan domain-containing zinc finger protein 3-like isoform X3 n=1 Tax=Triticum dicoccoides TaxID=85692 RepID=UPI00188E6D2D|nr:cysteine-tryptophan domain-containing zinc finger protein 3-like isoform X3 [Triticum dicoccoides]